MIKLNQQKAKLLSEREGKRYEKISGNFRGGGNGVHDRSMFCEQKRESGGG